MTITVDWDVKITQITKKRKTYYNYSLVSVFNKVFNEDLASKYQTTIGSFQKKKQKNKKKQKKKKKKKKKKNTVYYYIISPITMSDYS